MSRPLRIEYEGGWYHITARGNERRPIFRDDRDRSHFLELLAEVSKRFAVRLHAYVLMENHYHLLLELRHCHLSSALQWLNLSYSVWFNRRYDRCGHLFQGRFKSIVFDSAATGLELSRYVHLNPVRVERLGLSKGDRAAGRAGAAPLPKADEVRDRLSRLRSYRWSSYRAYIGTAAWPDWLDRHLITARSLETDSQQRERYRFYIESAVRQGSETTGVWAELKEGAVLGSARFLQTLRDRVKGDPSEQKAASRLRREQFTLPEIIAAVEQAKGEKWESFRDRHGDGGRDLVLYLGRRKCGLTLKALACGCNMKSYGSVAMAIKRHQHQLEKDITALRLMKKVAQMLNVKT